MKIDQYCQRQRCTCKHVELAQFLACFRIARVCQRQLGFLVFLRHGVEKVLFESTPRLLGVSLDCQLTFGPHTDELKKKLSGQLKVPRCLSGSEPVITQISLLHLRTVLHFVLRIILAGIHCHQSPPQTRVPTPRMDPDHHRMHQINNNSSSSQESRPTPPRCLRQPTPTP